WNSATSICGCLSNQFSTSSTTSLLNSRPARDRTRRPCTVAYWWLMLGGRGNARASAPAGDGSSMQKLRQHLAYNGYRLLEHRTQLFLNQRTVFRFFEHVAVEGIPGSERD